MLEIAGSAARAASFSKIDFSGRDVVVAAVSGGGDSLALLFLLKEHLARHAPRVGLLAVTVDHALRPEAAAEAGAVAALCGRFGVRHRTMRWDAAKPASGLQQAAREARYALLAQAAEEAGADLVFTGHTLDDQIETIAMRRKRGDGRGLAGIAPATLYDSRFWIVRPLLDARRQALRSYLRGAGIEWNEDPSNEDPKYERARLRAMLAHGEDAGCGRDAEPIEGMREAAAKRVELGERAGAVIRRHARRLSPGLYRLGREFADRDRDAALYALRILLAVAGGRPQLPDASRSLALFGHMAVPGARATLSRSVVETRADGLYLRREWRGLPPSGRATPGRPWDDRYRIGTGAEEGMEIAPFGKEAAAAWSVFGDGEAPFLRRAALAAEPALWRGSECLGPAPATAIAGPWARFLPSFDLAPAAAAVELIGGAPFPAPPWPNESPGAS